MLCLLLLFDFCFVAVTFGKLIHLITDEMFYFTVDIHFENVAHDVYIAFGSVSLEER